MNCNMNIWQATPVNGTFAHSPHPSQVLRTTGLRNSSQELGWFSWKQLSKSLGLAPLSLSGFPHGDPPWGDAAHAASSEALNCLDVQPPQLSTKWTLFLCKQSASAILSSNRETNAYLSSEFHIMNFVIKLLKRLKWLWGYMCNLSIWNRTELYVQTSTLKAYLTMFMKIFQHLKTPDKDGYTPICSHMCTTCRLCSSEN